MFLWGLLVVEHCLFINLFIRKFKIVYTENTEEGKRYEYQWKFLFIIHCRSLITKDGVKSLV